MARQLVFTSAPQGLTPGRTGYCTVARHRDLRERLASVLESLSVYPNDWKPAPVICAFRVVDVGGTRFPVLSRLVNAGQDYTNRSRFLAHHLALDPEETAGAPPPAEIFRRWPGWLNHWEGPPRWFEEKDEVDLTKMRGSIPPALPAETWARLAGDAGRAALLVEGTQPAGRVLRCPVEFEGELLGLMCEASSLLPPTEWWRASFTTCLQPSDASTEFRWAVIRAGSLTEAMTPRMGQVIDLTQPSMLPAVPENAASRRARGTSVPAPAPVVAAGTPTFRSPTNAGKMPVASVSSTPTAPVSAPAPSARAVTKRGSQSWIWVTLAGLLFVGVFAYIAWQQQHAAAPSTPAAPPTPPAPVYLPPKPDEASNSATSNILPIPEPSSDSTANQAAVSNEQTLVEITQLTDKGQALAALAQWKNLSTNAPDFTASHLDELNNRLLPAARKEWLAALAQITADLNAGNAKTSDLAARLAALHDFPRSWPVNKPAELEQAEASVAAMFSTLDGLPDAPVWIVDNLTPATKGTDYQDGTVALAIPELNTLLSAGMNKFRVAAAPATSLQPPPANAWFHFTILGVDYDQGNYLILHDASRGAAGGRFMQFIKDQTGQVKLTWRMFEPNSDFFQRFPANAPLGPVSRDLWLHFMGEPPLPSFYLLLRRSGMVANSTWKPVLLPLSWLDQQGTPERVALPPWLANHLVVHASAGESFKLEPVNINPADWGVDATQDPVESASHAQYQTSRLINPLNEKFRSLQTELARAQQQLTGLQTAVAGPAAGRPAPGAVDQATETVKKLQANLNQVQAAAQAAAKPGWALSAAPWLLDYNLSTTNPMVLLEFTANETRPTP